MTKKELRAIKNKREEEIQDRLENLDDDFAAVENILRHSGKQKNIDDSGSMKASASKFAKSLKQYQKSSNKKDADRPRDKKSYEKNGKSFDKQKNSYSNKKRN